MKNWPFNYNPRWGQSSYQQSFPPHKEWKHTNIILFVLFGLLCGIGGCVG